MVVKVIVKGFEEDEVKKLSFEEEKRELLEVSSLMFSKVVENMRLEVMLMLLGRFKRLRYEDLEEIYSDGCFVLWKKMKDKDFVLDEKGIGGYMKKICWNIGMHYLRKVKDGVESLDNLMEMGYEKFDGCEMGCMFDVLEDKWSDEEEKYRRLEKIWEKLSVMDRMILESYYIDGCKMDEIAKKIGYKNGNSVKSMKNRILKKIMKMRKEEEDMNKKLVA